MIRTALAVVAMIGVSLSGCQSTCCKDGTHAAHHEHDKKHADHHHDHDDHDDAKSVAIAWSAVPANVRAAFEKEFPGVKVIECEKETYANGMIHYEFEYKDSAGNEHDVEFSADGEKLDPH